MNENWLLTPEVLDALRQALPDRRADAAGPGRQDREGRDVQPGLRHGRISRLGDRRHEAAHRPATAWSIPMRSSGRRWREIGMPKEIVMRHRLPQFGHLFSCDAYSAGYYSYLWSETMDADTWAAFEEAGKPVGQDGRGRLQEVSAVDRQRDRPRGSLPPVPRPRSGRERAAQEARFPDRHDGKRQVSSTAITKALLERSGRAFS